MLYAFPWGEGQLAGEYPRKWFIDLCNRIAVKLRAGRDKPWNLICEAIASGNGIGKSAATAQLILWAMATAPDTRGVVTANTGRQLFTTTWAELSKWNRLCICGHWFEVGADSMRHVSADHRKSWSLDAVVWDATNAQAFAGRHNRSKRLIFIFDEASEIDDIIWEKADLTMSDPNTELLWFAFGNPTFSGGRFRQCWTKHRATWGTANIDSRSVGGSAALRAAHIAATYGEDSPQFAYGVKGEFIESDAWQLVHRDWLYAARDRARPEDGSMPKLRVSVDVADGGEDATVITVAHHFNSFARIHRQCSFSFNPSVAVIDTADAAERMFLEWGGDRVRDDFVVDALGVGAGTAGTLIKRGYNVVQYRGGETSSSPTRWRNRRVQSHMVARDALRDGTVDFAPGAFGAPHEWEEFETQATSVRSKPGTERVEDLVTKDEMKRNGVKSPDRMDSLVMQFATQRPAIASSGQQTVHIQFSNALEGYVG